MGAVVTVDLVKIREAIVHFQLDPKSKEGQKGINYLFEQYTKLINRTAGRYKNRGCPMDDLQQSARLGFVSAIAEFDLSMDIRGIYHYIERTVSDYLKRSIRGWVIKVGTQQSITLSTVNKYSEDNNCTFDEALSKMGFTKRKANNIRKAAQVVATCPLSADLESMLITDERDPTVAAIVAKEDAERLKTKLAELPPELQKVIALRMDGHTLQEVGELIGRSTATANNYQRQAIAMMGLNR